MSRKRVSLVLGSGGARGYTHIGVIEALNERGYTIEAISGSSMGALIGGLYAANRLDAYKKWVESLEIFDVLKLLDFSFAKDGMIRGDRVFEEIEKIVGDIDIKDLPIPFTAVATNLKSQKSIWFQNGNLLDAIRASIAMPTIFTPKEINGESYIDGGILSPLPTAPLLSYNSDLLIAVNLHSKEEEIELSYDDKESENSLQERILSYIKENFFNQNENEYNAFKIISKSIEMMQNRLIRDELALHEPDIIIEIPRNLSGFYDFHKAKELINFGKKRALSTLS
jgi:NTE family protein